MTWDPAHSAIVGLPAPRWRTDTPKFAGIPAKVSAGSFFGGVRVRSVSVTQYGPIASRDGYSRLRPHPRPEVESRRSSYSCRPSLGCRREEVGKRYAERVGEPFCKNYGRIAAPVLEFADLGLIDLDRFSQGGLGHFEPFAQLPHICCKRFKRPRLAYRKPRRERLLPRPLCHPNGSISNETREHSCCAVSTLNTNFSTRLTNGTG